MTLPSEGANMLQVAQGACFAAQGYEASSGASLKFDLATREIANNPLIAQNGDQELWRKLCALENPYLVRVIAPEWLTSTQAVGKYADIRAYTTVICDNQGQPSGCYPSAAAVGDQYGRTLDHLDPGSNTFAWCVSQESLSSDQFQGMLEANLFEGKALPVCPQSWLTANANVDHIADSKVWANRGSINAGFLVFEYLDKYIKGQTGHVQYNQCELLSSK